MSTALLTDRYELTMVQAALHSGKASRRSVFEVFSRQLPAGRRFGVVAGTGRLLDLIADFKFETAELDWLSDNRVVNQETLNWLSTYKFSGDISGYREGEIYFGHSPVLTVESSFAEAVILETLILSVLNFDSAIAAAASRMVIASAGRNLVEMGSRRGHENAAVAAARAAYIAGFDASSNLEAGRAWGVPTMGTAAHSFTLLHDTERQAFEAQLESMGKSTTLLVDTFDVEAAVRLAVELAGPELGAVRIDSGDLTAQAGRVRGLLDSLGATKTRITVTSDLDEFTIAALAQAPVDSYGVGTSLITGSGHPTAGFVYKLVSHLDGDGWVDVAKTSTSKINYAGRKHALRATRGGAAEFEVLSHNGESAAIAELRETLALRELQVPFITAGQVVAAHCGTKGVSAARMHHVEARNELPEGALRLSKGDQAIELRVF